MASGIARALTGGDGGKFNSLVPTALGKSKRPSNVAGKLQGLEDRVQTLESSGGGTGAAPEMGQLASAAAPTTPGEAAVDQAVGVGAQLPSEESITTGRFSDQALSTANQVYGGEQARQASVGQLPAAVAGTNEQTTNDIQQMINEQSIQA